MPRHIEQPATRQSKPASRNTRSRPSASACALTCWEPGTTIASTLCATLRPSTTSAAARRSPMREFVQEPMNTRSSAICSIGVPGSQVHVGERALGRLAVGGAVELLGRGHALGDGAHHPGVRPPRHLRGDRARVDHDLAVELGAVVGGQLAPALDRLRRAPAPARRARDAPGRVNHAKVVSSGAIMPGAAAALDRHVADGHPPLHRQRLDRGAGVLDDVAGEPTDAEPPERAEDQVLGGHTEAELALVADAHRARLVLDHALRRQHVLDLARADPERERAERAVRGGVRVAAHDRHARLGDAQLGADHVHDPLAVRAQRVDGHAELARSCAPAFPPARARARP